MTIREYIDNISCYELKELALKLCKKYGADLDDDLYWYTTQAGGNLNGRWLSLSAIFDTIDSIY